jgi:hypothetical protein
MPAVRICLRSSYVQISKALGASYIIPIDRRVGLAEPLVATHPTPPGHHDPQQVPNVKFNVCKMLATIAPLLDRSVVDRSIRPCLTELLEDTDIDVRYYAREAMLAADGA